MAVAQNPETGGYYEDHKIEVGFCELHDGIFVGGRNLTNKLDPGRYPELKLKYDRLDKELEVTWNGVTSYVPSTNIKNYIPGKPRDRKIVQMGPPQVANVSATAQVATPATGILPKVTAQVETPMSHVHAGAGHGKTGQKGK